MPASRSNAAPVRPHRPVPGLRRCARLVLAGTLAVAATGATALPIGTPIVAHAQQAGAFAIGETVFVGNTGGDGLLLREGPGFDATVLGAFPDGTPVVVTDGPIAADDGTIWYGVDVGGQLGYMLSDYLVAGTAAPAPEGPATAPPATSPGSSEIEAGRTGNATTSASPGTVDGATLNPNPNAGNGPRNVTVDADGPNVSGAPQTAGEQFASAAQTAGDPAAPVGAPAATNDVVNLRAEPSWDAEVLRVLPPAAPVTVTGEGQGEWLPVWYNGTPGWMVAQYLDAGMAYAAQEANARFGVATAVEAADLRAEPSADAPVVATLPAGASFTPEAGPERGFYRTTVDGVTGWVSGGVLSFEGSPVGNPGDGEAAAAAPPTAPAPAQANADGQTETAAGEAPAFAGIAWPVSGGAWYVMQGYNGSSHVNRDANWQYAYALDLAREDADTAGAPVSSPVNGVVRWTDPGTGGLSIDLGNGHAVAMFHITLGEGLEAGTPLRQGDPIGVVSGPGGMGFAGSPHLHLALWKTTDGGNWDRQAAPFVGPFAIAGNEFPDDGKSQQHRGFTFRP